MRRVVALALLVLAGCGTTEAPRPRTAAELNNHRLSPALSQWLVGPIARLASEEQIQAYLALTDDAAAAAFIEAYWAAKDPDPRPANPLRVLFERRAGEADRRFSEAGYLGRRTDRGTLFVLYGEPKTIDFELNPREGDPPLEKWIYVGAKGPALDGGLPSPVYRFVKKGDLTVLYNLPVGERPLIEPPSARRLR